jgi:hypothetical protein
VVVNVVAVRDDLGLVICGGLRAGGLISKPLVLLCVLLYLYHVLLLYYLTYPVIECNGIGR